MTNPPRSEWIAYLFTSSSVWICLPLALSSFSKNIRENVCSFLKKSNSWKFWFNLTRFSVQNWIQYLFCWRWLLLIWVGFLGPNQRRELFGSFMIGKKFLLPPPCSWQDIMVYVETRLRLKKVVTFLCLCFIAILCNYFFQYLRLVDGRWNTFTRFHVFGSSLIFTSISTKALFPKKFLFQLNIIQLKSIADPLLLYFLSINQANL